MVKLAGPMFSLLAQGTLGKSITYALSKYGQYARTLSPSYCPKARDMNIFQQLFRWTVETWQHLPNLTKISWNDYSANYYPRMAGFHAFSSHYLKGLHSGIIPTINPPH
jgi:hypothetical protein